jgi:hypothetical protein
MSSKKNNDDILSMAYSDHSSSNNSLLKENMNQAAKERRKQRRRLREQEFDKSKTDKSDDKPVNSSIMSKKPPRRNSKPKYSGTGSSSNNSGSIIWTILVIGLVFCVADVCYIIYFVERYPDLLARTVSRFTPPKPLTPRNTLRPNLSHEKDKVTTSNDLKDKEHILNLLKDAGVPLDLEKDKELLEELPTWSEVTSLYGSEPVIYGLDKCEQFRTHSDPADHFVVRLLRKRVQPCCC